VHSPVVLLPQVPLALPMLLQGMDIVQALDLAYDHQLVLLGQLDQSKPSPLLVLLSLGKLLIQLVNILNKPNHPNPLRLKRLALALELDMEGKPLERARMCQKPEH
jgi:hypothetical protein